MFMGAVWADSMSDLKLAANSDVTVVERESAFAKIVSNGSTEIQYLLSVAKDVEQTTRLRWVAIRALGQIRGPQAESLLLGLLDDPEPAIRTAAVSAVGDLGNGVNSPLLAVYLKDPAVIVRVAAAEALGKLQDSESVEALGIALQDEQNQYRGSSLWVRAHFVIALGSIGSKDAYPVLLKSITDSDPRVVQSTVRSLEMIAGFSFGDGRSTEQEIEAWSRWLQNQLK
jgi:HEAT repeat protein